MCLSFLLRASKFIKIRSFEITSKIVNLMRRLFFSYLIPCRRCQRNETIHPDIRVNNNRKLDKLTSFWSWDNLERAFDGLRVNLRGLTILTSDLKERLQHLAYATSANLSEHRVIVSTYIQTL